jgi:hypothetical protein
MFQTLFRILFFSISDLFRISSMGKLFLKDGRHGKHPPPIMCPGLPVLFLYKVYRLPRLHIIRATHCISGICLDWHFLIVNCAGVTLESMKIIGFLFKENLKGLSCMQKAENSFCEFITGSFYVYVFNTQASSNPFIKSSMGRQ